MPPRLSRKCTPHLPLSFVKALSDVSFMQDFSSAVYTEAYHRRRLRIVDQTDYSVSTDDFIDPRPLYGEAASIDPRRAALHHAAAHADPLAVCELIRLRATVNFKDSAGDTALAVAIDRYCAIYCDTMDNGSSSSTEMASVLKRLAYIIKILLEQHADVDVVRDGNTFLHQLCSIGSLELIELFLQHGCTSSNRKGKRPIDCLWSEEDRARYRDMIRRYTGNGNQSRPPRSCPCMSGSPQEKCHGSLTAVPYPSYFYCICGSRKLHANCNCSRQNLSIVEAWEDEQGVIRAFYSTDWEEERANRIMLQKQTLDKKVSASRPKRKKVDEEKTRQSTIKYVEELADKGMVDPAFAFALKHTGDLPRPGKKLDPRVAEAIQAEWNGYVDEYIQSGVDARPIIEIERYAKIGLDGGALHRRCDAKECNKWEGQDGLSLRMCSRCKSAWYCSEECQRNTWKDHRALCSTSSANDPSYAVRALPSQSKLGKTVLHDLGDMLETLKDRLEEIKGGKGKDKGKERGPIEFMGVKYPYL